MVPRCPSPDRMRSVYFRAPEEIASEGEEVDAARQESRTQPLSSELGRGCALADGWDRWKGEPVAWRSSEICGKCAIATDAWMTPTPLYLAASRVMSDSDAGFSIRPEDDTDEIREAVRVIRAAHREWRARERKKSDSGGK